MFLRKKYFYVRAGRVVNLACVILIFAIFFCLGEPCFPKTPSQEQIAFARMLCADDRQVISVQRKSFFPLLGRNQIKMRFVLPADMRFADWHFHTLEKIAAKDIEVWRESITAVANTREGVTVRIRAELRQRIVHCHLAFQ